MPRHFSSKPASPVWRRSRRARRSAEQLGFDAALTPTSTWCEDAWVMTAALSQVTERFRFLVAFRPGLLSRLSPEQIEREQARLGIDEFILSGYPHVEEAYRVGEGVFPALRRRGLLAGSPAGSVAL